MSLHKLIAVMLLVPTVLSEQKLPRNVVPVHYDVSMNILIDSLLFTGKVCITVYCKHDTQEIKLHGKQRFNHIELDYAMDFVSLSKTETLPYIVGYEYDKNSDVLTIRTSKLKRKNEYRLCIRYKGAISAERDYIIYKPDVESASDHFGREFPGPGGQTGKRAKRNYVIATNFERQSFFPCFDDPDLVAKFTVQLTTTPPAKILINDHIWKDHKILNDPARSQDTFKIRKVPASHIAFVLTNMDFKIRSYELKHMHIHIHYLETKWGPQDYKYEMKLPNHKMEISWPHYQLVPNVQVVALPTYERLVSFKLGLALANELEVTDKDSDDWKHRLYYRAYCGVFGGVIPLDRWESKWMFNALAEIMAYWQRLEEPDYMRITAMKMELPEKEGYSTIVNDMNIFEEENIAQKTKGVYSLQMMQTILGSKLFAKAIVIFIHRFEYTDFGGLQHMWELIGQIPGINKEASVALPEGISLSEIMTKWTSQPFYPLLTVTARGGGQFSVTQEIFTSSYKDKVDKKHVHDREKDNQSCWIVLLPFEIIGPTKSKLIWRWLDCSEDSRRETIIDTKVTGDKLVLVNPKYTALHRLKYDDTTWEKIVNTSQTSRNNIDPNIRASLVNDILSLAWMGHYEPKTFSRLKSFMEKEDDDLVWQAFFSGGLKFNEILKYSPETYSAFQNFVTLSLGEHFTNKFSSLFTLFSRLDPKGSPVTDIKVQYFYWACNIGVLPLCTKDAKLVYDDWLNNPSPATGFQGRFKEIKEDPALVSIVMCKMLMDTSNEYQWKKGFEFFFRVLRRDHTDGSAHPKYKAEVFKALICLNDEISINRILDWVSKETSALERSTKEDKVDIFLGLTEGPGSYPPMLEYFYSNIDTILLFHDEEDVLAMFVKALTSKMKHDQLHTMERFIKSKSELKQKDILDAFEEGKIISKLRSQWLQENESKLRKYLSETDIKIS